MWFIEVNFRIYVFFRNSGRFLLRTAFGRKSGFFEDSNNLLTDNGCGVERFHFCVRDGVELNSTVNEVVIDDYVLFAYLAFDIGLLQLKLAYVLKLFNFI